MKKAVLSFALAVTFAAEACMTFVVGKKVSATGHVIVGHNEDDWPPYEAHHGVVPARDWPEGAVLPATEGCNPNVPQAPHTLAAYWGEVKFPYGDGNADTFLNERGVFVVSDSGGNSTERMDDPTLLSEGGVKFNLRRAVGERATSARDGVRIICELVEKYGYAPSARIYTVADRDEAWLVQVVHGRNYVAVRCPDDEVTIMPNLYTVYELDAWPAEDVIASPGLLENAKRKGFWDGVSKFNFAKAYQGSYDYGEEHAFEHPNNTWRFRQAIRLLTGEEWPEGRPFPFSVKPAKNPFTVEDLRGVMTAHNGSLKEGRHVLESWSICSSTTIESEICVFADSPRDNEMQVAVGRGCEKPYHRFRPFREGLPAEIDESATAEQRLASHVAKMDRMLYIAPAPGRSDGRIYYHIPPATDYAKPSALLVFLHGGSVDTTDSAPERYFGEGGWAMPAFADAPFIVAAPSAPPAAHGSRWNQSGVWRLIDATIEDARNRFNIDPDRIFLGGHSMGCYGAYHLGEIMADRFAGVWCSAGGWWETDFRAFLGTPVYIQHGAKDCSPAPEFHPGLEHARKHHWCGPDFARAADELMTRYGVEHVYDEHSGGHSLSFPQAQEAMRRFFAWSLDKRRNPYARRCALVTPCGTSHPGNEDVVRSRWLELVKADSDRIVMDAIELEGPDVAKTDSDLGRQAYRLGRRVCPQGARIVAENLGGNRFRVQVENVAKFRILLAPAMGDLSRPFIVELEGGGEIAAIPSRREGDRDYSAEILVALDGPSGKSDGAAENGGEEADRLKWFTDARFGMFIHFGAYSLAARHEWVKNYENISDADYAKYSDNFDPDLFDAKAWVQAAKDAGMKYIVLTTKHHEGFCLFDSKYTDYKSTNTPFRRDVVKEFADACHEAGMRCGFYYSLLDWHHPDYTKDYWYPGCKGKTVEELAKLNKGRDFSKYVEYLHNQVREILTNYGKVDILWYDFSCQKPDEPWWNTFKHTEDWKGVELMAMTRRLQPGIIINDRLGDAVPADVVTPEQKKTGKWPMRNGKPAPSWETCQTFSGSWGYYRDETTWKSVRQLLVMIIDNVSKGGNTILNVGPTARGDFDARAKDRLAGIGKWMKYNSRAIYGCGPAPEGFVAPEGTLLTYNKERNRLYVHLVDYPIASLPIKFSDKVKYSQFLHDASEVKVKIPLNVAGFPRKDVDPSFILPVVKPDVEIPVIEVMLK